MVGILASRKTLKLCLKGAAVTELLLIVYMEQASPILFYRNLYLPWVKSFALKIHFMSPAKYVIWARISPGIISPGLQLNLQPEN